MARHARETPKRRRGEPVDVLVVCTGNLCRSPMIATLLAASVPSLTVTSAGTGPPLFRPWHPLTVEALAEIGHVVEGRPRRLHRSDVAAAKLILTAEGAHRAAAVRLDPSAEDRAFTLLEAARLLKLAPAPSGLGPEKLAAHLAAALRANPAEHHDDLADPILGDIEQFRVTRQQVQAALGDLVPALRPN
jgi:protein-tyrosine phosphatase